MEYKFSDKVTGLQASAIREILKFTSMPEVISFAAGNPAPEAFPSKEVNEISAELLNNSPVDALQYSIRTRCIRIFTIRLKIFSLFLFQYFIFSCDAIGVSV